MARRLAVDGQAWNLYGPTETTIWSTLKKLHASSPVTIGRPISATTVYVLDEALNLVPVGTPGELYIGGAGLARGYLGRPELTTERFVASPFETGERLYRTGDLVRWTAGGELDYLGRLDHQVKIRGYRIELGEIDAELLAQVGVEQAIVMARQDQPGDKRFVAYLVGGELEPQAVRDALRSRLPEYMIPVAVVVMEAFPQTANGKIDRAALPVPTERSLPANFVPPVTPTEIAIANIWKDVLGIDAVSVHDNFFDLGGDSIQTIQVAAKLTSLGKILRIRDLFQHQTIAQLATYVDEAPELIL